jgi:C-terminal processing protease CtpA/Prc
LARTPTAALPENQLRRHSIAVVLMKAGGSAAKAGVAGDQIVSVNGNPIRPKQAS